MSLIKYKNFSDIIKEQSFLSYKYNILISEQIGDFLCHFRCMLSRWVLLFLLFLLFFFYGQLSVRTGGAERVRWAFFRNTQCAYNLCYLSDDQQCCVTQVLHVKIKVHIKYELTINPKRTTQPIWFFTLQKKLLQNVTKFCWC